MFNGCSSLNSLNLPNFIINKAKDISGMFSNCPSLNYLDISHFSFNSSDLTAEDVFSNSPKIKYINMEFYYGPDIFMSIENYTNLVICIEDINNINSGQGNFLKIIGVTNECEIMPMTIPIIRLLAPNPQTSILKTSPEITSLTDSPKITSLTDSPEITSLTSSPEISILKTNPQITEFTTNLQTTIFNTINVYHNSNNCSGIRFFNDECTPNNITDSSDKIVSDFIYNILDDIEDGKFNDIFNEIIAGNKTISKSENNVTYQISTVSSQYKSNLSSVALENCESKLKEIYSLDKNEQLILLKVEYNLEEIKIPIIEYQLFLKNGTRVNLSYCDNIPEIISIPVNISEDEEFIHNPNSDFYDDKCYVYTSKYNTDLTMYDRKKIYNEKYYALCEKNCEYKEYNKDTKSVECECRTKNEFPKFSFETNEINKELNLKELLHQFVDVIKHSNFFLFKCYKAVFSSEGLKKNSGSYITIIIISGIIFCTILFGIKGLDLFKRKLSEILGQKSQNTQKEGTSFEEFKFNVSNNFKNQYNTDNIVSENTLNEKSTTEIYNDFEMNNLDYKTALDIDKRTFFQSYVSLIKTKQPIYYTFFLDDDYNSRLIKICLFLFSFPLEYAINGLFFNDSTMHKIYEDRGKYNFVYQLPQIIYSFLISYIITKSIDFFNFSEEKISKIKKKKNQKLTLKIISFLIYQKPK